MIADYKLYHGAVLADIVDRANIPITIEETEEQGRLLNYKLNGRVGLQIKFTTKRMRPWSFSFTERHVSDLGNMDATLDAAFLVLVCGSDGIVAIRATDVLASLKGISVGQSWLRLERRKREHYRVHGPLGELPQRYSTNTSPIVLALAK
jgi:hypothetical protein